MARSRLRGAARVRRLLKAMPDAVRADLARQLEAGAKLILAAMRARTPRKTGALQAGLSWKALLKGLRIRVGLLGTRAGRSRLFYGHVQNFGRAGGETRARRMVNPRYPKRRSSGDDTRALVKKYVPLKVKPMAPKRFVTGRYPEFRRVIGQKLRGIWDRALVGIGGGSSGG